MKTLKFFIGTLLLILMTLVSVANSNKIEKKDELPPVIKDGKNGEHGFDGQDGENGGNGIHGGNSYWGRGGDGGDGGNSLSKPLMKQTDGY